MKDLRRREAVTNGRKELKGKEESNLTGGALKPKEGSSKRNRRVAIKQTCQRKDCIVILHEWKDVTT